MLQELKDLQTARLRKLFLPLPGLPILILSFTGRTAITTDSPEFTHIKAFKLQMEINLGHNAFHKLRRTFPELPLPSLKVLRREMKSLSGMSFVLYDMCVNSCMLFAGKYSLLSRCMHCRHPRRRPNRRPYQQFHYLPFIPQIQSLYANTNSARMMRYRHEHQDDNTYRSDGRISDVYDSEIYRKLRQRHVVVDGERLNHKFFSGPRDVFLTCMTDGFQLFKR
ncbi:hypothetical protein M407DRAFT_73236, partial [Tulasnella calospora MUT 4182]